MLPGSGLVAAMAAVDRYLQRCSCTCGSSASTPGCSSFELSNTALGLRKLRKRHGKGKQLLTLAATRSVYSPLVDTFRSTELTYPYSISTPGTISRSTAGDAAHGEKLADIGQDMERTARARPPTMSLSQGFTSSGRWSVSHTVGAVGHPVTNTTKLPGSMGVAMAFAVAALGLKTAVEKQGLLSGAPQKVCEKCDGYGVQQCHVCQGRGVLSWEGKLRHTDPCPLCFGSCLKKCSSCGGVKMKKGMPPAMVTKLQVK